MRPVSPSRLRGFAGRGHGRDEAEVRIRALKIIQLGEEGRIFRTPVGVEEEEAACQARVGGVARHGEERRDADAAGKEYSGSREILVQHHLAVRPSMVARSPAAPLFSVRLKAVVAHARGEHDPGSCGALAIVSMRASPAHRSRKARAAWT
jgi:hypothetical protein